MKYEFNKYQTELTEELVNSLPQEVQDQLFDIINNVEFVKRLISPTREYAKDRPRDDRGRIIVDLANPHILEDMDYFRPSAIHYEKYGTFTNLRPNANPNSEYGKWVREERRRIWDGYVRESDGEWVTGYMYWFLNYSPMMLSKIREYKDKNGKKRKSKRADRIEALPECWEGIYWRFHCLDQASNGGLYNNFEGGQHMAELASRGKGKAHPYDEVVYTPKGKKLWGDIKIGDLLYDENGGTTKVVDIPFNDVAPIYEVKFSNGETVRCSEGHLWEVKSHDDHDKTFILSTKELLSKFRRPKKITSRAPKGYENNYTVINAVGVEMPKVDTNIDPYTFGLLLGDGCFRHHLAQNRAYFTSSDEDFETYSKIVPYNHKKGAGKYEYTFEIPKFGDYLKSVGLYMAKSEDKFIPDEYKYNSKEVRVNLLKGLLDSDGTVTRGRIELVLTSKRLIDDVKWVLSSLGISYTKERVKHTFYYDRNRNRVPCKNAYRLSIFSNLELFNLNRKLALWRDRSMGNYGQSKYRGIKIVDIRYIGEEKAKCVTVDSPTHKYLIGTFIPTHNSYSLASILNHIFVVGENEEAHEKVKGIVTAYQKEYLTKDGVLNKFVDMANFCATNTQFPRKRLKSSLQEMTWIMGYKDVELDIERGTQNTVLGVSSKDDESKLRGKRAAKILIEEFGCHIKGTKVLMYDGSIKNVENITVGDVLMGDDNTPRVVQELYNGTDQLYKITLSNGDYQIVNSHHPVYFKKYNWNNSTYTEHTLTAPELLEIKNLNKGYYIPKAIIHFPYTPVVINPYFLGLWLGDGDSTRLDIANEDAEVLDWLSDNYEGTIRDLRQSDSCKVFHISKSTHVYNRLFSKYGLYNNKHIPKDYKINASEVQLQVIAGLIDTDGTYNSKKNFFEITQRYDRKHILDDIKFMCECNGLKCSLSSRVSTGKKKGIIHYRLRISGNLSIIPTKINRKKGVKSASYKSKKCWNDYTFKVEPYKVDEYYGFTVDKNHLFVLGDLTVTHNTFPRLVDLYNVLLPSVQEGDIVFGQIYMLGCVCAGTKVWTLDGRNINIEDLKKEDGIIGYSKLPVIKDNYVIHNNGITRESIGKVIEPVEKDCVKITLSNGNTLMCSTDHPIFVQTKSSRRLCSYKDGNRRKTIFSESFVKANQLKVGDRVCECRKIDVFGNSTLFDSRLVGMLIGDGSYGNNETPKYSSEDRELLEYVKDKYDTSLSATHITKKGNIYEDIRVKGICSYLKEIGIYGQVKQAKRLPSNYQTLTRNATIDLLSGLYDTDGTFYSKGTKSYIGLTQCNIEILKEVQVLWRKFGVICSIKKTNPRLSPNRKDRNPWFTLIINGADNLKLASRVLLPIVTHKKEANQEILSFFDTYVPKKIKGYDKDYLVYKVVSIEYVGKQVVYNLSACTSRTYLANNIITHNTAGDNESDFAGAQEIMYNPKGYNMYAIPNVYDKFNQGKPYFVFFFPGYVNRKGCYNENGVSDVIKALIEILMNRYRVKYNSTDPNTIIKTIAEVPITPAEAIVKTGVNMFPVADLTERIGQLDANPTEYDDVYVGDLVFNKDGQVEYKPTSATPIRDFPHKDNKIEGAIEIYQMPEIDKNTGKPYNDRYILGADPYDDDESNTMSLGSIFVLDLWTDRIVAEYTGRPSFADDYYEICRKLCLFYNGRLNYEYNKKGLFSHFSTRNSLYLLTDVLDFLKEKQMMKDGYGNKSKGTNASPAINAYARSRLRSWLLAPVPIMQTIDGEEKEVMVPRLFTVRNRALLKELINYNSEGNFDRISAMGMLMLLREDRMIRYQGDVSKEKQERANNNYDGNDLFFKRNYDFRFRQ